MNSENWVEGMKRGAGNFKWVINVNVDRVGYGLTWVKFGLRVKLRVDWIRWFWAWYRIGP